MRRFLILCLILLTTLGAAVLPAQTPDLKDRQIELFRRRLESANTKLREETTARIVYQTQIRDAAIHDFKVGEPLSFAPLTPEVLDRLFRESIEEQYPGASFDLHNWIYRFFGAIPDEMDVGTFLRELMVEQAGGLYDPTSKKLYISPQFDVSGPLGRMILAHEIGHALQDQNFDLKKMGISEPDNDDRSAALMAVVEGDATLLMGEVVARDLNPLRLLAELPKMAMMDQEKLATAPPAIRDSMLFPYLQGALFFQTLAGRTRQHPNGDPGRMLDPAWRNDVLADPPLSTEQVLHPEKYLANERPVALAPVKKRPQDHSNSARDVVGEFGMRLIIGATLDTKRAERAVAGWNGDRILVTGDDPAARHTIHWETHWDTPGDAEEFLSALADALEARFGAQGLKWSASDKEAEASWGDNRLELRRTAPDTVTFDAVVSLIPGTPAPGTAKENRPSTAGIEAQ